MNLRTIYCSSKLIVLLLMLYPALGHSQKVNELEMEIGLLSNDLDDIAVDFSLKYNRWFNPHVAIVYGGMISSAKIDFSFDSPQDEHISYDLDEDCFALNGILGLKLASPVYKKVGVMADVAFLFEPIPFNVISPDKQIYKPGEAYPDSKSKTKTVYTHFNPSYAVQLSLFYEMKHNKRRGRFALGGGIGNRNQYNVYYRAKVDGYRLKDFHQLRPDKPSFQLFIRYSGTL